MAKRSGKGKTTSPDTKKTDTTTTTGDAAKKKGMMDGEIGGMSKKGLAIGAGIGGLGALTLMGGKDDDDDKGKMLGISWWVWLIGGVAVVGLIIFIVMMRKKKSQQANPYQQNMGGYNGQMGYGMQRPMYPQY